MKYNDKEKKIRIKIVQIDNNELAKCKLGKEFKMKFITLAKSKPPVEPEPPVKPIGPDTNNEDDVAVPPKPPKPTVADAMKAIADLAAEMRAGFNRIDKALERHDEIFKRNNLH